MNPTDPTTRVHLYKYSSSLPSAPSRRWWIAALALLVILLLVTSTSAAYLIGRQQGLDASITPTPLTTPSPLDALKTSNFPKFIQAFSSFMAQRDYNAIRQATDTEDFQMIPLADDRYVYSEFWDTTYSQLLVGLISFEITYPTLSPDQLGYSCIGYTQQGISEEGVSFTAQDVKYVVGTLVEHRNELLPSENLGVPATAHNGTVFVFELPFGAKATWLWYTVTLSNQAICK